jgi:hypothetical protein
MISTGYFPLRLNDGTPLAESTEFARTGSGEKVKHEVGALVTLISLGHVPVREEDEIGAQAGPAGGGGSEIIEWGTGHHDMPHLVRCARSGYPVYVQRDGSSSFSGR